MLKNRKSKTGLSVLSIALGGGLVYASANEYLSVGADSVGGRGEGAMVLVVLFVVGIALIAVGTMTAFFMIASKSDNY